MVCVKDAENGANPGRTLRGRTRGMYLARWHHGNLTTISGSRQHVEEEYQEEAAQLLKRTDLTIHAVLPRALHFVCTVASAVCHKIAPCFALTMQHDRPEVPRKWR